MYGLVFGVFPKLHFHFYLYFCVVFVVRKTLFIFFPHFSGGFCWEKLVRPVLGGVAILLFLISALAASRPAG